MVDATLAQYSNEFVYGSMAVYAGAFVSFAACLARGTGRAELADQDEARRREQSRTIRLTDARATAVAPSGTGGTGGTSGTSGTRGGATGGLPTAATAALASPKVPVDPYAVPGRRAGNIGLSLMWLATLLLGVGMAARGFSAGRAPWGNMYEFSVAAAFAASAVFLGISLKKDLRWLGVFIAGAVLLTLGLAVTVLYTESAQLVPALKSYWLVIHVLAAIICAGAFTVGAFTTVLFLVRERAERKTDAGPVKGWLASRVPSAQRLDTMAYRVNAFVFPLWTFAVIAGAIWAENAWGRYWGWDPKETWAFITWVVYAGYLHARATAGWRGRKAAVVGLVGYGCFLFNYFGVNLLVTGLHSYGGLS